MIYHPERFANVDPRLVELFQVVGGSRDIIILAGARSVEDEQKAIDSGHSKLTDPYDSKHVIGPNRPLALAVDVCKKPVDWKNLQDFIDLSSVVKSRAKAMNLPVTWGGDWHTFKDMPHYELPDDGSASAPAPA